MAKPNPQFAQQFADDRAAIEQSLMAVHHKIVVLSGKGGVGKSTVAVNLACALAKAGKKVALFDADFHGPTVPVMLGLTGQPEATSGIIEPMDTPWGIKAMSIGSLLPNENEAVIWRGPMKMGAIKQLLTEVNWGAQDYMIFDSPPGTGDEPLSLVQLVPEPDGAIIVSTPQEVALRAVRKSIKFCQQVNLKVLGIVENFAGYMCPHCNEVSYPFGQGGGEELAQFADVKLLASIPLVGEVRTRADAGKPIALDQDHQVGKIYKDLAEKIENVVRD